MALEPGDIVDNKYRIVGLLGEGGMGAVYEGEHTRIRRRVAIKVLLRDVGKNEEMVSRFEQEAQVAGTVGNDHILEIYDLGVLPSGEHYMVMEYLDGQTLDERLSERGKLDAEDAAYLIRQVLTGLAAAHDAGVVHRDLKPENLFILHEKAGKLDFVKIIDFGISKFADRAGTMKVTRTGTLMGTPQYMSPEQASGRGVVDERSDLYAVGIILYEMLTGRSPFEAETFNQLLFEIALANIIPPRQVLPDINPGLESIILKATARDPARRFQSADEFVLALDAWTRDGKLVSVPPEESLATVVASAVPRASALPNISDLSTGLTMADGSSPHAASSPMASSPAAQGSAGAGAAPQPGTVNTWTAAEDSERARWRARLPLLLGLGAAMGVAIAIGAYLARSQAPASNSSALPPDLPSAGALTPLPAAPPPSAERSELSGLAPSAQPASDGAELARQDAGLDAGSSSDTTQAGSAASTPSARKAAAHASRRAKAPTSGQTTSPSTDTSAGTHQRRRVNFGY